MNFGYLVNKFKEYFFVAIVCLVLAVLCTIIVWPGIYNGDTYMRINNAHYMIQVAFGITSPVSIYTHVPIAQSLIMAVCKIYSGQYAFYTIICAFLYLFFTYYILKKIDTKYPLPVYLLLMLNPVLFLVCCWNVPDIIISIFIALFAILLADNNPPKRVSYMLIFIYSFIIFGYRFNSYTILPVILFFIFTNKNYTKINKWLCTAAISAAIIIGLLLPKVYNIHYYYNYLAGPIWEMLHTIKKMPEPKQDNYSNYLDELGKTGATYNTIQMLNTGYGATSSDFVFSKDSNLLNIVQFSSQKDNPKIVLNKYVNFIKENPKEYIKTKFYMIKRVMGIGEPLYVYGFDYDYANQMEKLNFRDSEIRHKYVDTFSKFASNSLLRYPFVMFAISFFLVLAEIIRKSARKRLYVLMFILSVFYYGAFFVTTHAFEARYFFPAFYLLSIMNISISFEWISSVINYFKKILQ